jgi:hypothetical protein
MSLQGDSQGSQDSNVRCCSPRVAAQNKGKEKANVTWQERKKGLRLPNNPVPVTDVHQRQEEGEADADVDNEADKKKRRIQPPAMRCSPAKFLDILKLLPKEIKHDIKAKGFGGLLDFKPKKHGHETSHMAYAEAKCRENDFRAWGWQIHPCEQAHYLVCVPDPKGW